MMMDGINPPINPSINGARIDHSIVSGHFLVLMLVSLDVGIGAAWVVDIDTTALLFTLIYVPGDREK